MKGSELGLKARPLIFYCGPFESMHPAENCEEGKIENRNGYNLPRGDNSQDNFISAVSSVS